MCGTFGRFITISSAIICVTRCNICMGDGYLSVGQDTVLVGGCVTVLVSNDLPKFRNATLQIADRAPVKLSGPLGRNEISRGRSIILLSHDLTGPVAAGEGSGTRQRLRIPPIFAQPGVVELTINVDGDPVQTESIKVQEAGELAQQAIDLLFPTIERNAPRFERERGLLWLRLVIDPSFAISREELQQLRDELPIIKQHPDWAEIAEMLVARLEARSHSHALIERKDGEVTGLRESIDELPPWPDIVTRCLEVTPHSTFAGAIQEDIWTSVKGIRILDAERRGEDIIPIVKSPGPPFNTKSTGVD